MTDQDPAFRSTEAARSPSGLLALGLVDDDLTAETLAAALPQYDAFERVGGGGMGVVWSARQIQLDRRVAIKLLRAELATDPSFAERFAREARALAKLQHPGIVAIHDYGEVLGRCYLVMEFVDGTDLRSVMRSGLAPEQALAIVPQICDALQYAHDEGIVHRDVKPENILVDRRGRVKIADFGLAKLRDGDDAGLTSGRVLGTPHYMAPEQLDAHEGIDHRADIFALGVVIYEMLTGKLPVGRFSAPSRLRPVDVRLDEVVLRSLEHDRDRRYQHASDVKDRIVAIGPKHERLRPEDDEVARRITREKKISASIYSAIFFGWIGQTIASGIWWTDHSFGYKAGTHWRIPIMWWPVAFIGVHLVRTGVDAQRHRGTPRGAAQRARMGIATVVALLLAAWWFGANTGVVPWLNGNPIRNATPWLIVALFFVYGVWTEAVQHHVPARIVLGPSWWIHRWEAELEPRS